MTNDIAPWSPPALPLVEYDEKNPAIILSSAQGLKSHESQMILRAVESGLHQMAAEFLWSKAMANLMKSLSNFGARFIGEMLDRSDITDGANLETYITQSDAILLGGELGLIDRTGSFRLKQNLDLLQHMSDPESSSRLRKAEMISIIENSIQYILQRPVAPQSTLDFRTFRDKLLSESFSAESLEVKTLLASPYFFQRTAVKALISGLKETSGAKRQHVIINSNVVIPSVWLSLSEEDRFSVGRAYAEFSSMGDTEAVKGLRIALGKISGFDYVPESIRSDTFRQAAQAVIRAHNSFNNYYLEIAPTKELAKLGSVIPKPALAECMRAYLCVYVGNKYGHSWESVPIADTELRKVPVDNWIYYINSVLFSDRELLWELRNFSPAVRFIEIVKAVCGDALVQQSRIHPGGDLVSAIREGNAARLQKASEILVNKIIVG
jgi:hypothetical protein